MLPRVILHNAVSLDGRIDGFPVDLGQFYGLVSGWREDATLAGADTVCQPGEPVPPEDAAAGRPPPRRLRDRRPLLVVPDSRGRVRNWHVLQQAPYWRGMIALCSRSTPRGRLEHLRQRGIGCIVAGDDHVDLRAALAALYRRHRVRTVRVDSGGTLNGVLLRAGLVSEVSVVVHPVLVGGAGPGSIFRAPDPGAGAPPIALRLVRAVRLRGGAVWLRYKVLR